MLRPSVRTKESGLAAVCCKPRGTAGELSTRKGVGRALVGLGQERQPMNWCGGQVEVPSLPESIHLGAPTFWRVRFASCPTSLITDKRGSAGRVN